MASRKGEKDSIDVLGLLFYSGLDIKKLRDIAREHKLLGHTRLLLRILKDFKAEDLSYLNLNKASFSKLKHKYAEELSSNL
jgi:hypothetical protein